MATIQWLPTNGTNSFNTPANWQGGVVPGVNDIAFFTSFAAFAVTGNATVGELDFDGPIVTLTGTIATSGTQPDELLISDTAGLTIAHGAAVTGNGQVLDESQTDLDVYGTLTAGTISVEGELVVSPAATLTGIISLNGGALNPTASNTVLGNVIQVSGTGNIILGTLLLTGALNGNGSLEFATNGGDTITGNVNRYTGAITIDSNATLVLALAAPSNSLTGGITDTGNLEADQSGALTLSGVISGAGGALTQFGSGVTTLTNSNNFTGGTQVFSGTLAVANGGALGTGPLVLSGGELLATATETIGNALTINNGTTIAAAPGQVLTMGTTNAWTLSLNQTLTFGAPGDNGTVVWKSPNGSSTPSNLYVVFVQDGTLRAGDSNFSQLSNDDLAMTVAAGAALDLDGQDVTINNLEGTGSVINSAGSTLSQLVLADYDSPFIDDFDGVITGDIELIVATGAQILTGANTYTGGTFIDALRVLQLSGGGSITGAVTDQGVLAINESGALTLSGVISSTGAVAQFGTGTTTLAASNNYSGGTTIFSGTLELVKPTSAGSNAITFVPGADATLQIDGTQGLANQISGFDPGDSIDFANIAATSFTFPGPAGTLTVSYTANNVTTSYHVSLGTTGGDDFVLGPDGEGGTRLTSVPVFSDFTGDGNSDILLNNVNGAFTDWEMNGTVITAGPTLTNNGSPEMFTPAMTIAGIGDFTGLGPADILVHNGDGTFTEWTTNGSQITSMPTLTYLGSPVSLSPSAYSVVGVGDFNGAGPDDILLRNTNGSFTDWTMNGSVIANSQVLTYQGSTVMLPTSYSVVGIGDFNGSGEDDVLLRSSTGSFTDWTMNGSQIVSGQTLTYLGNPVLLNSSWSIAGVGDFTGAGQDDILLRNTNDTFTLWTMNGAQIVSSQVVTDGGNPVVLDPSWSVVEIGDFSNSGQDDVLLRNTNGLFTEWVLNGSAQITGGGNVTSNGNTVFLPGSWQTDANPTTGGGSGTQIIGAGESLTNPIIGGGTLDLLSGAAVNGMISFAAGTSGTLYDADQATDTVVGFTEGIDYLSFSGENAATVASVVASAQSVNGNTILSFPDHTSLTLLGVSQIDSGAFA